MMQAEATVLGVHHGELGGIIARHWNIPDRVCEAITHHHAPDRLGDVVCDVVALANVAAKIVEPVGDPATANTEPPQGAATRLGLAPSFLDRLCSHVGRRVTEVLARFESRAPRPSPPGHADTTRPRLLSEPRASPSRARSTPGDRAFGTILAVPETR